MIPGDREATQEEIAAHTVKMNVEIKRRLLADAMVNRDILLGHLRWFYAETSEPLVAAISGVSEAANNPDLNLPVSPENQGAIDAAQAALSAAQAVRAAVVTKRSAIYTAINSLQGAFNDHRVVDAVDGEVKPVLNTIKNEIGIALAQASPATYYALLGLDAL